MFKIIIKFQDPYRKKKDQLIEDNMLINTSNISLIKAKKNSGALEWTPGRLSLTFGSLRRCINNPNFLGPLVVLMASWVCSEANWQGV